MARLHSLRSSVGEVVNPLGSLEVKLVGGWVKLKDLLHYFSGTSVTRSIKTDIATAQRKFLREMKINLVHGLATGGNSIGHPFAPHSPNTHNATGVVGVHHKYYLNALHNAEVKQHKFVVSLYMRRGDIINKPGGEGQYTVGQYSYTFEVGSLRQPPRPLWHDTYAHMGGDKEVHKRMVKSIGKRLRKMGIQIRTT